MAARCRFLGLLAFLLVPSLAGAETALPLSPLDPAYPDALEQMRRGLGSSLAPGVAAEAATQDPTHELGIWARPFFHLRLKASDPHRQITPLYEDLRQGAVVDPFARVEAGARLDARLHEGVSAHLRFRFNSAHRNETLDRTREFDQLDATNNFDEAFLRLDAGWAEVRVGRFAQNWGPERLGSLLLSATAPAPDMIHASMRFGAHRLQTFAGQLSGEVDDGETYRRWLYGHRADLFFADDRIRVGISELAVVAGIGEGLNLRYFNPVSLWAQVQVEDDEEDATSVNILNAVDAEAQVGDWRLYGTWVVDDLQIDPEGREKNPDQLAGSVGADWRPWGSERWLLGYEYRRVGSFTYLRRQPGTDFRQFRRPLGAAEGPDGDRHNLRIENRFRPSILIWLEGEARRRGINRLSTEESRLGLAGISFPRGKDERRASAWLGSRLDVGPHLRAQLEVGLHDVSAVNNVCGDNETIFEVLFALELRTPAWGFTVDGSPGP